MNRSTCLCIIKWKTATAKWNKNVCSAYNIRNVIIHLWAIKIKKNVNYQVCLKKQDLYFVSLHRNNYLKSKEKQKKKSWTKNVGTKIEVNRVKEIGVVVDGKHWWIISNGMLRWNLDPSREFMIMKKKRLTRFVYIQ